MFLLSLFVVSVALYLLGVRFVGKPLATYSWHYWYGDEPSKPTVLAVLLYPAPHCVACYLNAPLMREEWRGKYGLMEVGKPLITTMYDKNEKDAYVTLASFLWPLRLLALAFLWALNGGMLAVALTLRWCVFGPLGKRVIGSIDS